MNVKGHGTAVAIALSVIALAAGGTGAAVAATSTVTISDPAVPSRVAHVDPYGRLTTVGATSVIGWQGQFLNAGAVIVSSPTTASLAITQLALSETQQNAGVAGSDLSVRLVQTSVDASGACTTTAVRYIALTALSPGEHVDLASGAPFVVKPMGTAKYCLGISSAVTNGAADVTSYYPYYTLAAYAAAGTYTGLGTQTGATAALPKKN